MAIQERFNKSQGVTYYMIDFRDQRGRRVRETAGTTRTQAKDRLKQRLGEVKSGTYINPNDVKAEEDRGPTLEEFAIRFLRDYRGRTGVLRSEHYETQLKAIRAHFRGRYLKEITREDLDLFGAARGRQVVKGKAVGPSTVRKSLVVVGTLFKIAVRWGVLEASPAIDLQKPAEPKHKTRYLSAEEWKALREKCRPWLREIVTVAVATGARLKEVVGLRWEDVDEQAQLLYFSEDNKTGTPRAVPIGGAVREVLDARGKLVDLRTGRPLSPYVFTDDKGQPRTSKLERGRVGSFAKSAMRAAGIKGASFHTLRHTAGSWAAQAGASETEIAKLLGHATAQTTRRYTHLRPEHLKSTVRALDAAVCGLDTPVDTSEKATSAASANTSTKARSVNQMRS